MGGVETYSPKYSKRLERGKIMEKYIIYVKSAFGEELYVEEFDNYDEAYIALKNYQKSDPFNQYYLHRF